MRYAIAGAALLLAACSSAPPVALAPPGQDAAGKQFNPPPAGMAAVYFYNPTETSPAINVTVGQMVIGTLAPMSYMRVELNSGWHALSCQTYNSTNPSSITVAPGQIRFIDVEMPPGAPVCSLRETSPDAGRAGVLAGARAMQY
ncbi:MAG: hypothetical protein ISP45_22985 [Reyranella sp.]|jgi:hypothetical protein|nr:hypothetical protein [Reyranella sp.]